MGAVGPKLFLCAGAFVSAGLLFLFVCARALFCLGVVASGLLLFVSAGLLFLFVCARALVLPRGCCLGVVVCVCLFVRLFCLGVAGLLFLFVCARALVLPRGCCLGVVVCVCLFVRLFCLGVVVCVCLRLFFSAVCCL